MKVKIIKDVPGNTLVVVESWFFFVTVYRRELFTDGPEWFIVDGSVASAKMWFFLEDAINSHRWKHGLPK